MKKICRGKGRNNVLYDFALAYFVISVQLHMDVDGLRFDFLMKVLFIIFRNASIGKAWHLEEQFPS